MTILHVTIGKVYLGILSAVMILSGIAGILFFFLTLLHCKPVRYFWDQDSIQGTCLKVEILVDIAYFYSAAAAVCDLTIAVLPAFFIRKSKLRRRDKFAIAIILGIGGMFVNHTHLLSFFLFFF